MTKFGAADRSSSNKAGVTLMNNQVGYVVAEVMRGKEGVEVTELPSMIRVDGVNQVEFGYEEMAEALGWDDFGNDDFEEIMSTHYGRMVVLDDRVVLFANPEDAAEYIGFDLKAVVAQERTDMYEKDGEQYFVFDSHLHFWDASPANWVKGQEQYAKGWIECFHAYMGLAPAETHWTLEHFQKYSVDDFEHDVFENGHVDQAVFQSTYLKDWYTEGFNDIEHNAALLDRFPGKLRVNGRWDPRDGEAGLQQLEADHAKYGMQGVKLYTAEWKGASRGWKLTDPEAVPFLEKCVELGIKNVHVHKGPTIWPLDKDAFDVSDIDHVATDFQELNFIVEHVGLPRIEDFCFMATQEPNVYAGLAVVVGGLMHARPRFFAKVMGELLFWVGEDKMLFGSDYAIWEPKWQVEGLVDWDSPPATSTPTTRAGRPRRRRRCSASTRPSCTASRCRTSCGCPPAAPRGRATTPSSSRAPREPGGQRPHRAGHGVRPRAGRADHRSRLRRGVHRV